MFETYDLKNFSERLKNMRTSLGYSQSDVSIATGISTDTLRKLENGYSLPRYDTLSYLSHFYKTDLHRLLNTYQQNHVLFEFYKSLDYLMMHGKFEALKDCHNQFLLTLEESGDLKLINPVALKQIELFISGISLSYNNQSLLALEKLYSALELSLPEFEVNAFESFSYSFFELRILITVAACLGEIRKCHLSTRISKFILTKFESSLYSDKHDDINIIKSLSIISYNYHRLDHHDQALNYAQQAIDISIEKGHLNALPFLLLRKAVAKMYLGDLAHHDAFKECLYLIKITGDSDFYTHVLHLVKNQYKLDFSSL
ncbi:MAG: hypothetical protein BGO41_08355 [Clostridiales bacterium 38-18]|nr:MAG: hypothetical protein BGO41_08355 [Clostridiales bacterium 38-18]